MCTKHMLTNMKKVLVSLICISLFANCAPKWQNITLDSNVHGTKVYGDGKYLGRTPLRLKTNLTYTSFYFDKEGYKPSTIYSQKKWNFWRFMWCENAFRSQEYKDQLIYRYTKKNYYANLSVLPSKKETVPIVVTSSKPSQPMITKPTEVPVPSYIISSIPSSLSKTAMEPQSIFRKYNSAVFMIYTDDGHNQYQGSGFFINSSGLALSNYHVFKNTYKGNEIIKLTDGKTYKVKEVLAYSEKNDFILFKVDGASFNYIPVSNAEYEVGEKVYAIGSPKGLENTFTDGMISQIRGNGIIQISVPIDHGSSGGVLINKFGEAIGITSGGMDDSHANLNYAIDIRKTLFNKY